MEIDHIGYAVKNIEKAKAKFEILGYSFNEIIKDEDRNIYICFGNNENTRIELVSPIVKGESPVDGALSKMGPTPYHICYKTRDIDKDIEELTSKGFLLIIKPKEAIAFGGSKVAFLMNLQVGMIELVER